MLIKISTGRKNCQLLECKIQSRVAVLNLVVISVSKPSTVHLEKLLSAVKIAMNSVQYCKLEQA